MFVAGETGTSLIICHEKARSSADIGWHLPSYPDAKYKYKHPGRLFFLSLGEVDYSNGAHKCPLCVKATEAAITLN